MSNETGDQNINSENTEATNLRFHLSLETAIGDKGSITSPYEPTSQQCGGCGSTVLSFYGGGKGNKTCYTCDECGAYNLLS